MENNYVIFLSFFVAQNTGRTLWELYSIEIYLLNRSFNVEKSITKEMFKVHRRNRNHIVEINKVIFHMTFEAKITI